MKAERESGSMEDAHPRTIENAPGQRSLSYRVGDFMSFRKALLESLPTERDLLGYSPSAKGDLALAMLEWWAYLADILTFYNERAANSSYLGTAQFEDEVARLVRVLGHRRSPGMGATATLAALVSAVRGMTLPAGMAIQSKPGPGEQPQIFELGKARAALSGGAVPVDIVAHTPFVQCNTLMLEGTITNIKPGDWLLLMAAASSARESEIPQGLINIPGATSKTMGGAKKNMKAAKAADSPLGQYIVALFEAAKEGKLQRGSKEFQTLQDSAARLLAGRPSDALHALQVKSVGAEKDLRERPRTRITLVEAIGPLGGYVSDYRLLRPDSMLGLCPQEQSISAADELHLSTRPPPFAVGEPIFIEDGGSIRAARVAKYFEAVWKIFLESAAKKATAADANAPPTESSGAEANDDDGDDDKPAAIFVLHGVLKLEAGASGEKVYPSTKRVRYGFREVGKLLEPELSGLVTLSELSLIPASSSQFPAGIAKGSQVLIEDITGVGALALVDQVVSSGEIRVKAVDEAEFSLTPPLRLLSNLFEVSRGATVAREVLGSGDASAAGQSFVLAKGPLTYFRPVDIGSGAERTSTLSVYVNGVAWMEVSSFYGQAGDAPVFVTREDSSQKTWVMFGDGVHGARLPTGTGNIVASYRYGSGASAPAAGALTTLVSPKPGLVSVRNPVAALGGADPESSLSMRKNAPRAALALGRAVSADDYEAIAALVPGVTRARAAVTWDVAQQRALVAVWVHGTGGVEKLAKAAIAAVADPNRPFRVNFAESLDILLKIRVLYDPKTLPELVEKAVRHALLDADIGIFGQANTGIGAVVYKSRVHAACLVPGAVAIRDLFVASPADSKTSLFQVSPSGGGDAILNPGSQSFVHLEPAHLDLQMEEASNA